MEENHKQLLEKAGFTDTQISALSSVFTEQDEDLWDLVKYFRRNEFACKCGGRFCNGFPVEPCESLVRLLDAVRGDAGTPCIISSGVRCETHNRNVGGVVNSWHKKGKAADFALSGKPASETTEFVKKQGWQVIELYAIDNSYVHVAVK